MRRLNVFGFPVGGPPKCLVSDGEGAINSHEARLAFERCGCELKIKPTGGIGASTVERHHGIARDTLHQVRGQTNRVGIAIQKAEMLSEAIMVHNALLNVHGYSPYQALTGRTPNLLHDFARPSLTEESEGDPEQVLRNKPNRVREIAVAAMVEGTQKDRIQRALRTKSRMPGEALGISTGDLVDFWRQPAHKDQSGWIGPAKVVNIGEGTFDVKWQSHIYQCQARHVRKTLV